MAKQLNVDEAQLRVVVDGSPARKELATLDQSAVKLRDRVRELTAEQQKLQQSLKGKDKMSAEYKEATTALERNRKALVEVRKELSANGTKAAELRKEIGPMALSLRELRNEASRLRVLRDTASSGSEAFRQYDAQLQSVNERIRMLTNEAAKQQAVWAGARGQYKLSQMSMQQLEQEAAHLKQRLYTMVPTDPGFAQLRAQLQATERQVAQVRTGLGPLGRAWDGVEGQVAGAGAVMMTFLGGTAILQGMRNMVSGSAKLSDANADVMRTTGLNAQALERLNAGFKTMDTRTPRAELLALAADAGKLGISAERDVMGFVRAGNQIRVALGEDLGEDAIKSIGKLNQTFKVGQERGLELEESMLRTGSAINQLGQSSTAAEGYLVDFTTRIAGVNVQSGISIENTLGYAAALDQLGLQAETSSTAFGQFTLKAFKDPAAYAKIAGMELKEFNRLLREDTNEALLRTLEGLNGNNAGMQVMVNKFGDMGQEGARAIGVLSSLASNVKLVREQQTIANKSFAEGTSITNEYNVKNQNLAGNLEKLGKWLHGLFVNNTVVNGINNIVGALTRWISVPLSAKLEQERIDLLKVHAQILSYNQGNEKRTALIRELQAQYPGFLQNINAETLGNRELGLAVRELNTQLANKIILQRHDEKIQDQITRQADIQQAVLEREDDVRERLVKIAEKNNLQIKEGVPLIEQARAAYNQLREERERAGKPTLGRALDELANFGAHIYSLSRSYERLNSEQSKSNTLTEERAALMKRLGLVDTTAPTPATPAPVAADQPTSPIPDAEADKKLKEMQALREELLKIRRQMELDAMSADEREIAQLDDKFAELRRKVVANARHTAEDLRALDEAYEQSRANLLEQQAEVRAQKVIELQAKARAQVDEAEEAYWLSKLGEEDQEITMAMQRMEALVAIYEAAGIDTQQVVERTEAAILATREKYRLQEKEKARQARVEQIQQQVQTYQGVAQALGGVNALLAASYEAAGNKQYEQTTAAKVLGLAQIAIASAVGVAEAIKAGAGIPFPGNLAAIATGVGAVLSGIASAIALLNSGSAAPKQPGSSTSGPSVESYPIGEDGLAASGRRVITSNDGGAVLDGPSHANEGLKVVDPRTGKPVAEVEGGELMLVLSKAATKANADLIPQMLAASKAGRRMSFLDGPLPQPNVDAVRGAMRVVHMADGGYLGSGRVLDAIAASRSSSTAPELLAAFDRLTNMQALVLEELRSNTAATRAPKPAVLRLGPDHDREQAKWEGLKERNTIRRRRA